MPTIGQTSMTLADWGKRLDPNGAVANIIEVLAQQNEMINDAPAVEGNLPTGHLTTVRAGLPDVYWRVVNQGVPKSKSHVVSVQETCGMMEAYSRVDERIVELASNGPQIRFTEDQAFIEAMSQEAQAQLLYGNTTTDPEKILGFAPRFASPDDPNGDNVIDHGGAGSDNTSIYLIGWSPLHCHLIFPKGTRAGLEQNDLGKQLITDETNQRQFVAWVTQFVWRLGLAVRNWQYVVRIGSIDLSDLDTLDNTKALITSMIKASERTRDGANYKFYMNRRLREKLRLGILEKISTNLTWETVAGNRVMMFDGIPVGICDQILNTEDLV